MSVTPEQLKDVAEFSRDAIEVEHHIVELRKHEPVEVYLAKVKDIPAILDLLGMLMKRMGIASLGDLPNANFADPSVFMPLVAESSEQLFKIAAGMSTAAYEDLASMDLDNGLKVLRKLFAVNKSFFFLEVIPILRSMMPDAEGPPES